jgi:hypothetical protein
MREIIFFIASLAGATVLTALAILLQPASPLWKWLLWGGISVLTACSCVILIDYLRPHGKVIPLIGIGFGIGLCILSAIAFIATSITGGPSPTGISKEEAILNFITGGDSFAYLMPQTHGVFRDDRNNIMQIPLVAWNGGDYPLNGVTFQIVQVPGGFLDSIYTRGKIVVPTLAPRGHDWLSATLSPDVDDGKTAHYVIYISAQNGMVTQGLEFRSGKYSLPLAFRLWVDRQVEVPGKPNTFTNKRLKEQLEWSDDLGDGKPPTTNPQAATPPTPSPSSTPTKR